MQVTEAEVKNIVLFFNNCIKGHFIIATINKGRLLLCQNDAEVFFFFFLFLCSSSAYLSPFLHYHPITM